MSEYAQSFRDWKEWVRSHPEPAFMSEREAHIVERIDQAHTLTIARQRMVEAIEAWATNPHSKT